MTPPRRGFRLPPPFNMLRSDYRLRRDQDFDAVFEKGRSVFDAACGVKFGETGRSHSRFAVVVGTKVSKSAVKRNRVRRQYREIIQKHLAEVKTGFDVILLTSAKSLPLTFQEKEAGLLRVLAKARLML